MSAVTAAEGARLLGVDRHLVYSWRDRGKISPVGSRAGAPVYRWDDLVRVERDTRTSGRSYRGARCSAA